MSVKKGIKLVHYDKADRVSTIAIADEDLSLIVSVLGGIAATWSSQDPTILGLTKERFDRLETDTRTVLLSHRSRSR